MQKGLISVIIPTYNSEKFIEKALLSIENQSYKNIEVIVVDDCSEDNTVIKLSSLKNNYSYNIKILKLDKNSGQGNARNKGIDYAEGEYIFFLDSDDTIEMDTFEKMISCMKRGIDLCMCSFYRSRGGIKQSGNFYEKEGIFNKISFLSKVYRYWPLNWISCIGTKLYKIDLINKHNIRFDDYKYRYNEDLGFIVDYLKVCDKIRVIKDELYCYNYTLDSVQHKMKYRENSAITIRNARLNFKKLLIESRLYKKMEKYYLKSQLDLFSTMMIADWDSFYQFKAVFTQIYNFPEIKEMPKSYAHNFIEYSFLVLATGKHSLIAFVFYKLFYKVKIVYLFLRKKIEKFR